MYGTRIYLHMYKSLFYVQSPYTQEMYNIIGGQKIQKQPIPRQNMFIWHMVSTQ